MKIIIIGAGKTGVSLIENLVEEKHTIVCVDTDPVRVQETIEKFDVNGVVGNGCLAPIQQEAGVSGADLLIAVTDQDEINILSCLVGKSLGARHIIAQVRSPEYYSNFESLGEHLGVNMFVNLQATLADKVSRIIKAPAEVNLSSFARGRLEMAEFRLGEKCKMVGKSLLEIRASRKRDFLIVSIERNGKVIVPNGASVLEQDDVVTICSRHQELRDILGYFGIEKMRVQAVMVLGGGEEVYYLCKRLVEEGIQVKVICKVKKDCEHIKCELPTVNVVCDDYNDKEVLLREGLDEMDAFVAMTPSDENNIVSSLYAKTRNMGKVVTIVNSALYNDMLSEIELNLVLSPYELAGVSIATYIRSINVPKDSQIISMSKVASGLAEALQFNIGINDRLVGKTVAELGKNLKSGLLLAAIVRRRVPIIPHGDILLEEDDNIVVIAPEKTVSKLEDILK